MSPIVSVIIPTANRPHYLPRAVNSALAGMQQNEIEIIVVPNGPDESWKESLKPYKNNPCVKIIPIQEANANIARNRGMEEARGEFLRFLDDDDYLFPDKAIIQYQLIRTSNFDITCGAIDVINSYGKIIRTLKPPEFNDFCESITSPIGFHLIHAYVYRKNAIQGLTWDPHIKSRQDVFWLFKLCQTKEVKYIKLNEAVGVWQHHWGTRISTKQDINDANRITAEALIQIFKTLEKTDRLTEGRRRSIAQGLWFCVHAAFFLSPVYWAKIAKVARHIDPQTRPIQPIYQWPLLRFIDPLIIMWALYPKKFFMHLRRNYFLKHKSDNYW
ncbi:MAG: glycosyltransferase family 2 protein [Desulfatiglans sp.]|nr:glycosyltransferase family 2 protein [Desulfatiglans sp.]